MKWIFLLLVAANVVFALSAQLKGGGELQYSRLELNPDKIQLVLPEKRSAARKITPLRAKTSRAGGLRPETICPGSKYCSDRKSV